MQVMADNRKTDSGRGRPRGRKETEPIQARVSPELYEALQVLTARTRRTKNVELVLALEKHLAGYGLWPQPATDDSFPLPDGR